MPESGPVTLRARHDALGVRLDAPDAARELDELKAEIGALFKAVELELSHLNALRGDVLQLVDRWKAVKTAQRMPIQRHCSNAWPPFRSSSAPP